jgi:ribosome-associated protein
MGRNSTIRGFCYLKLTKMPAGEGSVEHSTPASLVALVQEALEDAKANEIETIDVRGKTSITDFMVVASGNSTRHVKTLAESVVMKGKQAGVEILGVEGDSDAEWVLVDLADVLVHLMLPRTRAFYNLENLWSVGPAEAVSESAG